MEKLRWGLMGAGTIIERWILGAKQCDDMEIVAVASKTPEPLSALHPTAGKRERP